MKDDGYIKFNIQWEETGFVVPLDVYERLRFWRNKLFDLKLIGAYKNGIGYGNISEKIPDTLQFYISGSATGNFKKSTLHHYALVSSYNIKDNFVSCFGPVKASSESLSHAAIYESNKHVGAVIHIHDLKMWEKLLNQVPSTSSSALFGTPEIAFEIKNQVLSTGKISDVIVMAGHKEGILFYGENLDQTGHLVLDYFNRIYHD